jgi:iron complex transport system substrate-binding protein
MISEGLSVYRVDAEKLTALKPDLILTQTQCHVCAVSEKDLEGAVCQTVGAGTQVLSTASWRWSEIKADFLKIALALGCEQKARLKIAALQKQLEDLKAQCSQYQRAKGLLIEWIDPLLTAGHWMPDLAEFANVELLRSPSGGSGEKLSKQEVVDLDPDFIVIAACGWSIERALPEAQDLFDWLQAHGSRACRSGRFAVSDGNLFFNRPGPRLVETAAILASIAHPKLKWDLPEKSWQPL